MQIIGISNGSASTQALHPILFGDQATTKSAVSAAASATVKPSSKPTANDSQTAPATQGRSAQSHGAAAGGGGGAAAAATQEMLVSSYSTTVNGTRYAGSIEQSGSEYTASVSGLPGATATGSSITAAENNLNIRIDELV